MLQLQDLLFQMKSVLGVYLPKAIGAALLVLVAWLVAVILRAVVRRVCRGARLDERAGSPISGSLADMAYWFVFLFFLPGILETLGLQQLLIPVQAMVGKVMNFLPNLLAGALIFLVGYYIARLVRTIIANLTHAAGIDKFSYNVGMAPLLGQNLLSQILGKIVFAVMIVPVAYSALNALALHSFTQPIENVFGRILAVIPALLSAGVVLFVAHYLGRFVAQVIAQFLAGTGFNGLLAELGVPTSSDPEARTPSDLVGMLTHAAIMIFAVIEASNLLGFGRLSDIVSQFIVFGGQLLTGVVIFVVGLYVANLIITAIKSSGVANADRLSNAARIAVLVLATTMALRQMGLAPEIIQTAFTLLLGAGAVAIAISFGMGGRETAAKMVEEWRAKWVQKTPPMQSLPRASTGD